MLLPRGLYSSSPPEPRSRAQNNPTLLFSWWCTGVSLTVIVIRLLGRMIRNNQLFKEDKIMFFALVPLLIRMGLVHVILIWGTNNVDVGKGMSDIEIYHRSMGSRLVLASRIFYAMFIWSAKYTVSEFLKRLTSSFWKRQYEMQLHMIRGFLVATFFAVVIATLTECAPSPFDHYWQVVPDPGPRCRQGYAQLITMGTADMITDVLLIVFPINIVVRSTAFKLKRKLSLLALFSMSAVLVGITGYRVKSVIWHRGRQQYRSVFASGEILAATAVSNAVVIGSFLRDRGVKKQKFRYSSGSNDGASAHTSRRHTMNAALPNDSDSDLFRDMCYRTAPELEEQFEPRAPPIATATATDEKAEGAKVADGYFPPDSTLGSSRESQESEPRFKGEKIPSSIQKGETSSPRPRKHPTAVHLKTISRNPRPDHQC
ncbi:hypothetical protein EJ08DRAFT_655520 [Tothia fuscella]|uniref:Rhodopsin domain-containing protein n=1 Tax=Tothia fuscella TaxID=1048955 RepID=A0A9P4P4E3_9PEZI|nr:hypothetical protein EJ08DRAFT_655520 [Tothia fuscella]